MKIVVISDTHISEKGVGLPARLLEALKNADMAIHAGDIVDLSLLDEIKKYCPQLKAVCGNMDPCEAREKLPQKEIIEICGHRIGIMHGRGNPKGLIELLSEEFKNDKVELVIFGHSHNPVNTKLGGVIYFNPGSPTDKAFAEYNSYGIIEINDKIEAKIIKI